MRKLRQYFSKQKYLLISLTFFVFFSNYALARKIFINEAVLASSNNQNSKFEVVLFITNPSTTDQVLTFSNSLFLRSYSLNYASFTWQSQTFQLARNLGPDQDTGGAIGISKATVIDNSNVWDSSASQVTVKAGSTVQILFAASPSSPSFYPVLIGGAHSSVLNSGTYFAQILFYGFISIADSTSGTPGFLIGSGSVFYPSQTGGLEAARSYDFQINNGRAF